jgi:pyruvate formate lyase activating enzyme
VLPGEIQKIKDSFIPEETFFNFLDERKGFLDGVVITGGEPTIQGDLLEFMKKIKERGFLVKLDSNGNLPEVLERAFGGGLVDYIAMDIKTSLDKYKELSGEGAKPENIARSVKLIMASGLPYEFRSTIVKEMHPKPVLREMAQIIKGARVYGMQAFKGGETLDPSASSYSAYSTSEMEEIAEEIFRPHVKKVELR